MKRIALLLFLVFLAGAGWLVPLAKAQDQYQVGAYGDYFRIEQTATNMAGLGGRVGYKLFPHVMVEGEINYDFDQGFVEHCLSPSCGGVNVAYSNLKFLLGLVGQKFICGHESNRHILTLQGSLFNY